MLLVCCWGCRYIFSVFYFFIRFSEILHMNLCSVFILRVDSSGRDSDSGQDTTE